MFRPVSTLRTPSNSRFLEMFLAPGPNQIGETGDNSYQTLFGRDWLLVWDREDLRLHLYQEALDGSWIEVTTELPPIFAAPVAGGSRRFSFAFDQSARIIVAYEDDVGMVRVTRWDASLNQYVQNVTFAGADPCVVMDAAWSHDVPSSDVLLFYLSADRTRVLCRVQRDVYAVEHELWTFDEPVILDRVMTAPIRYQVLISDAEGTPLPDALISDPYPYLAFDQMQAAASGPTAGDYVQVVILIELAEGLNVAATGPTGGVYADPIISHELTGEGIDAAATGPTGGAYVSVIINYEHTDPDGIEADATGPTGGDYVFAVLEHELTGEGINATATGPTGGSYDLA